MLKKEWEKKKPFKVGFINKVCNDLGVIKHSFDAKSKKIKKKLKFAPNKKIYKIPCEINLVVESSWNLSYL